MKTSTEYLTLAVTAAVATMLRVSRIADRSLWIDEFYSIFVRGSRSPIEIIFAPTLDTHPPLLYVLISHWIELFGRSAVLLRLLAVIFGVAGVVALYALGKTLFDERVGLLAAGLLAVTPMHIHASMNVRMYGLLGLLTILSLHSFVLLLREPSYRTAVFYVVATVLLSLTHVYAIFIVVAQNLYVLSAVLLRSDSRVPSLPLSRWISAQMMIGIWAIPGVYRNVELVFGIVTGTSEGLVGWMPPAELYMVLESLIVYSGHPNAYPYLVESSSHRVIAIATLIAFLILFGVAFGEHRYDDPKRSTKDVDGLYLMATVLVSVLLLPYLLSKLITPVYHIEATIPGLAAFLLIGARGISKLGDKRVQSIVVILLLAGLSIQAGAYLTADSVERWDETATYVDSTATSDDLVIFHPYWIDGPFNHYSEQNQYTTANFTANMSQQEMNELLNTTGNYDRILLVTSFNADTDQMVDTIESSHALSSTTSFGRIDVYVFTPNGTEDAIGATDRSVDDASESNRNSFPIDTSDHIAGSAANRREPRRGAPDSRGSHRVSTVTGGRSSSTSETAMGGNNRRHERVAETSP